MGRVRRRLVREKGVHDLIEAFDHVAAPHVGLFILGDGPERASIEAGVRDRGLTGSVRFEGALPHAAVAAHLRHADVVILPSWFEERGRVVLEAMAVGTLVVATRVGGIPASVRDGVNGLLVPPRSPVVLAAAIERILADPMMAASRGRAGRASAREHGTDALARATLVSYGSVVSATHPAPARDGARAQ